jgi:C-terminal processing protease CtpA/Prc
MRENYALSPIGWDWVEDHLVVTDVPESQGQRIAIGDVVLSIDGRPIRDIMREAEAEISAPTRQWLIARLIDPNRTAKRKFGSLGEGPVNELMVLELTSQSVPGDRWIAKLERRTPRTPLREARPRQLTELRPGVLYVDLTGMQVPDWEKALPQIARTAAVILDVRGYPWLNFDILGNLSRVPMLGQRFWAPIITHPGRRRWEWDISNRLRLKIQPRDPYIPGRKIFLTDGRAISFADSLMAVVEHYKLGDIVGEATAGTTGNANTVALPGGYGIHFTGERALRHDGSRHHGVGVKPTIPISRTLAGIAAGRDEVLERALKLLG